jgi:hypothetical protein
MGLPGTYNLTLYRGDSYHWQFQLWANEAQTDPADLTDVTTKAEIRTQPGGTDIIELATSVELPHIVHMDFTVDLWEPWLKAIGRWDLQLTYPSGDVHTVLAGAVNVTGDITDSTAALFAEDVLRPVYTGRQPTYEQHRNR